MAAAGARPARSGAGAPGGRLRGRHDRPLRAGRVRQEFRYSSQERMNLFKQFRDVVVGELEAMAAAAALPAGLDLTRVAVEPPRDRPHGAPSTTRPEARRVGKE